MRVVYVVDNLAVAKILVDPMRRAILELLRTKPMTQAKLASELGLATPSLNHHMKVLRSKKLVIMVKRETEKHGAIQKFFAPAAYLFVYDLDALPKNIARYFYPVSLERTRGIVSTILFKDSHAPVPSTQEAMNALSEKISQALVLAAKEYPKQDLNSGLEEAVYKIYADAIKRAMT
ncbi:Helix-turn-helix domain [Candidatus Nitrososphaera evergladensis SR1]|uniref:Helix-turn-helix domain n=1 Tax=Candidatus Nitrososphaera evergladensis SR1 TaxID=1459636 RepID=A0A075MNM7_9ARCH|nr:Helix-turn-helix domain [Candidatus Nitrososphaera evergladensis SR1]